jgi:two-component system sensor histidine kinase KdpD
VKRGRLRVLLGAAPGVGKTYTMLEEGARLAREGKDVVVAVVETHGRAATASMLGDLEIVPRTTTLHRGVELTEMDVDAVLARRPDLALVDELAHTNAPGSARQKRWQDVQVLLDAGISVVSTVNVQHIESLNDVVEKITGAAQRETVPDSMLRSADQIEVVDLAPQALRDRLAEGNVYPAARIDAALSNYFRLGNLTALRELALLWLADEVDSALKAYRLEKGIDSKWEARERVVVALTGGPEGETLIRRGARIAARSSGGELVTVHVIAQDGLREAHPGALSAQRALTEKLGGTYHQVVGGDVSEALVQFAKAMNASQLVIGVSRRSRVAAALSGPGIGATVIRESGDIDVHIVTHAAAGGRFTLPRAGGALTLRRRLLGGALALALGPLLTWLLVAFRSDESLTSDVLVYQLLVVVVALVGGIWPALFAAVLSGVTLDFFFVEPYDSITVGRPLHLLTLVLYVVIALLVSYVVDQAARRSRSAARALAESELLAAVAGGVIRGQDALHALLSRTQDAFRLRSVSVIDADGAVVDSVGTARRGEETTVVAAGEEARLEMTGPPLAASERRLLTVIAAQVETALEHKALSATADSAGPMAQVDKVRTALLAAVGHDLRRPLASATAAVTGLQQRDVVWDDHDRDELLTTAHESLDALSALVTNLLDVSRVQAGALAVSCQSLDVDDVLFAAMDELHTGPGRLELQIAEDVPPIDADPVLLQRVVVNLLDNAVKYAPAGVAVRLSASTFGDVVEIRVADQGPGISPDRLDLVFVPFQRLGDTDNTVGLGLGLAIAKGFTEGMGGSLAAEETPGGGLTMVVSLPAVRHPLEGGHA